MAAHFDALNVGPVFDAVAVQELLMVDGFGELLWIVLFHADFRPVRPTARMLDAATYQGPVCLPKQARPLFLKNTLAIYRTRGTLSTLRYRQDTTEVFLAL